MIQSADRDGQPYRSLRAGCPTALLTRFAEELRRVGAGSRARGEAKWVNGDGKQASGGVGNGVLGLRVICGALLTLGCLWVWSRTTESVNVAYFADWSSSANLRGFLGQWQDRFWPVYWVRLGFYLLLFAGTPVVWGVILLRGKTVLKNLR